MKFEKHCNIQYSLKNGYCNTIWRLQVRIKTLNSQFKKVF